MPTLPRIMLLAALAVSAVMIGGCGATPPPEPSPSPSASPVFASEEEALAAATEAYAAYTAMSDQITAEGGVRPERIAPYVTPAYLEAELASYEELRASENLTVGRSTFDSVRVQRSDPLTNAGDVLSTYVCFDVGDVRLLTSSGTDVTPENRPERVPLEVDFELTSSSPPTLLIGRSDVWSGETFC